MVGVSSVNSKSVEGSSVICRSFSTLAENPELHQRTKHVAVRYHYIREQVTEGHVDLWYVPMEEMVADGLTKSLASVKHREVVKQLNLHTLKL